MNDGSIVRATVGKLLVFVSLALFCFAFSMTDTAGRFALTYYREACADNAQIVCEPFYKSAIKSSIIQKIKKAQTGNSLESETKSILGLTTPTFAFTLHLPLAMSIAAFLIFIAGSGLAIQGDPFWILIDPNTKCTSLSRTQAILWTALILGGYATMSFFNIAFGTAGTIAAKVPYPLFPDIGNDLLLLLGIVAGSPIAATYLSGTTVKSQCTTTEHVGFADRFIQLFTNDASDTTGQLQISRMQCILITFILVLCYGSMLFQYAESIDAAALANAAGQHPLFDDMPPVTGSFTVLLFASHTIFQTSKSNWAKQVFKPGNQTTP